MSDVIINEVVQQLRTLPNNLQKEVLIFTRQLKRPAKMGVPGKNLLQFAGTFPPEDLDTMRQVIESDCNQVDLDEW